MKNIFNGILLGMLAVPIATSIYGVGAWFAYGFAESEMTFLDLVTYHAMTGIPGAFFALGVLVAYALPIFFLLRRFGLANPVSVAIFSVLPWVVVDGFVNQDIHHFIQFSWISLLSGFAFWLKARHAIPVRSNA